MDDMCWCPIPTCGSIAVVEKNENSGRCQHCEHHFCLDCKQHVHPFKRCLVHRIDLLAEYADMIADINEKNLVMEARLTEIYMKHCTKRCPNPKCGVRITLISAGCSHVQCTKCWQYMCWACGNAAKGQKHFKENPDHWTDEGSLLPLEVTKEMVVKYIGSQEDPYINIKTCCKCPSCGATNRKIGRKNLFVCERCESLFCYICNKAVESRVHYDG